jgi:hypothetical protein
MLGAETGLPFRAFQESIFLGKECIIIKNAQVWRAPHAVIDEFSPQEVLADRFRDFCRIYRPRNLEGFAPFINTIISRVWPKGSPSKPSVLHPVIEFARPIVETMIEAISGSDLSDILSHGLRLIGLGPGLKPSGDGYPGGLLFAFRQLCRLYQVPRSLPPHHFQSWLNVARVKTNPISFALLADHAHGFNSESLSRFVQALMRQGAIEEAVQQPRELEQLGKRTGIDLMAGLMTGMLLAIQHATPEERPAPARPYR